MENPANIPTMKEERKHPNDKSGHNVDDLDLIMDNLRTEARSLKISDVESMDRNELMTEIYRARHGITHVPEDFDPRANNLPH